MNWSIPPKYPSRAQLQGEKLREILRQMAVKNITRYNRGEEE